MVNVESLIPTGGNFIFAETLHKALLSFLYKNARNVRLVLFRKNSIDGMPVTLEAS